MKSYTLSFCRILLVSLLFVSSLTITGSDKADSTIGSNDNKNDINSKINIEDITNPYSMIKHIFRPTLDKIEQNKFFSGAIGLSVLGLAKVFGPVLLSAKLELAGWQLLASATALTSIIWPLALSAYRPQIDKLKEEVERMKKVMEESKKTNGEKIDKINENLSNQVKEKSEQLNTQIVNIKATLLTETETLIKKHGESINQNITTNLENINKRLTKSEVRWTNEAKKLASNNELAALNSNVADFKKNMRMALQKVNKKAKNLNSKIIDQHEQLSEYCKANPKQLVSVMVECKNKDESSLTVEVPHSFPLDKKIYAHNLGSLFNDIYKTTHQQIQTNGYSVKENKWKFSFNKQHPLFKQLSTLCDGSDLDNSAEFFFSRVTKNKQLQNRNLAYTGIMTGLNALKSNKSKIILHKELAKIKV